VYVVARFLALLELYRERVVAFEQVTQLGELTVRWTGDDGDAPDAGEYDETSGRVALPRGGLRP
jgi:segregation and condensation protein A